MSTFIQSWRFPQLRAWPQTQMNLVHKMTHNNWLRQVSIIQQQTNLFSVFHLIFAFLVTTDHWYLYKDRFMILVSCGYLLNWMDTGKVTERESHKKCTELILFILKFLKAETAENHNKANWVQYSFNAVLFLHFIFLLLKGQILFFLKKERKTPFCCC